MTFLRTCLVVLLLIPAAFDMRRAVLNSRRRSSRMNSSPSRSCRLRTSFRRRRCWWRRTRLSRWRLFAYVVSVARRLGSVQRELDRLESELKRSGRT